MSLRVQVKRGARQDGTDTLGIKRFVKSVLRGEGVEDGGMTIVLTDDPHIRDLNRHFRNQDRATDVLSFPLHEDDEAGIYLGDVVVSLDRAREQAPRFHNDTEAELARLLSHGVLHLLGYDHHSSVDARKMKAAERRALSRYVPGTLWPGSDSLV